MSSTWTQNDDWTPVENLWGKNTILLKGAHPQGNFTMNRMAVFVKKKM